MLWRGFAWWSEGKEWLAFLAEAFYFALPQASTGVPEKVSFVIG